MIIQPLVKCDICVMIGINVQVNAYKIRIYRKTTDRLDPDPFWVSSYVLVYLYCCCIYIYILVAFISKYL